MIFTNSPHISMNFQSITRPHDFINVSADFILKICRSQGKVPLGVSGRSKKSRINIALSGGSTPQEIYRSISKKLSFMPFDNDLHFYQVDERYVPSTDKDSNQKMITETFASLLDLKLKNVHFHFFDTSLPIKESLSKYTKELPKNFDLTILGIGPDGHAASLFPDSKALNSKYTK